MNEAFIGSMIVILSLSIVLIVSGLKMHLLKKNNQKRQIELKTLTNIISNAKLMNDGISIQELISNISDIHFEYRPSSYIEDN